MAWHFADPIDGPPLCGQKNWHSKTSGPDATCRRRILRLKKLRASTKSASKKGGGER